MKKRAALEDSLTVKHDPLTESGDKAIAAGKARIRGYFAGMSGASVASPEIYADKDGLPVTYSSGHIPEKKVESDEISVLWHELLSPLTVIKGYIATLLELDYAITDDQKNQYLRGIESASNRMVRLLENLRDITRLEETDILATHPISLIEMIKQIASEVQSQTTKHVIKVMPTPRLPLVKVDPEKIEQVLSNLLGNAVKYSPQGGDIEVEVRVVWNESELAGLFARAPQVKLPCYIVSVADTGIGIPEAEVERIFERFYRVNNKVIRSTPGAGLGLYICRLIVEAHGGHIWARNRRRGGSVLSFSLPFS
jgi:signal transduction histidine kinase